MEQTLQALSGILLKAIPTVFLVVVLLVYFKAMLFGPLERVLRQREELTEGARRVARESLAGADRKQQEYEARFREARAEVYRAQEETRRGWLEDQAAQVAAAHQSSEASVRAARQQIAVEFADAQKNLSETSATLADEIANVVLARRTG